MDNAVHPFFKFLDFSFLCSSCYNDCYRAVRIRAWRTGIVVWVHCWRFYLLDGMTLSLAFPLARQDFLQTRRLQINRQRGELRTAENEKILVQGRVVSERRIQHLGGICCSIYGA
jgi:hypothetical protein